MPYIPNAVEAAKQAGGFQVYPAGTYSFYVTKVDYTPKKEKAGNNFVLRTKIIEAPSSANVDHPFTRFYPEDVPGLYGEFCKIATDACQVRRGPDGKGFDSDDLVGCRFTAELMVKDGDRGQQNELRNPRPYSGERTTSSLT